MPHEEHVIAARLQPVVRVGVRRVRRVRDHGDDECDQRGREGRDGEDQTRDRDPTVDDAQPPREQPQQRGAEHAHELKDDDERPVPVIEGGHRRGRRGLVGQRQHRLAAEQRDQEGDAQPSRRTVDRPGPARHRP
jgi:hypothetical protein